MKRSVGFWQFIGFLFVSVGGVLLHYLFDWSEQSKIVAAFSGINESIWEHMKLLYFPLAWFAVFEYFVLGKRNDFWCIKLLGILIGISAIPIIYYFYNGAIGKSPDWLNITIFFIAAFLALFTEYILFTKEKIKACNKAVAIFTICFIGVLFIIFSYKAPDLLIFKDPTV